MFKFVSLKKTKSDVTEVDNIRYYQNLHVTYFKTIVNFS